MTRRASAIPFAIGAVVLAGLALALLANAFKPAPPYAVEISPSARLEVTGPPGEWIQAPFTVRNTGTKPISLLGYRVTCGCTVPTGLPATLAPGGSVELPMSVQMPPFNEGEPFEAVIYLTTNIIEIVPVVTVVMAPQPAPG